MAFPSQIGTPEAGILAAGQESAFRRSEALLRSLAGHVTYLGDQVGLATTMDLAILSYLVGSVLGFIHGARIYQSEGVPVESLGVLLADVTPLMGPIVRQQSNAIQAAAYHDPQLSLSTYAEGLAGIAQQAREGAIDAGFPTFALRLFRKALAAGYGQEEVAALVKLHADDGGTA